MNFIQKSIRYWHTLRYLRATQIIARIQRYFRRIKVDISPSGELREMEADWTSSAKRNQSMLNDKDFLFLNECHQVVQQSDWNNEKWEKLWLYNLHYFDDLNAVDAFNRKALHKVLIQKWVDENPMGYGSGWEPYPSSLRIINWIKWSLAGNSLEKSWLHSLVIQNRYLLKNIESHLLGNHLFANAKALLFAGLFLQGKEADIWCRKGRTIIENEIQEQILNDGGNFELSTMYHEIFLEDLLDIVNVCRVYGYDVPAGIEAVIPKMVHWLVAMCHPDGEISFFNDAAIGVTPSVVELLEYVDRLGIKLYKLKPGVTDFSDSGYTRVEAGEAVLLIDRAAIGVDYLPAHAHADALCFELSLFYKRVVVNSGTSLYGIGPERLRQRSTAAHSTVVLDGENSSEVWSGFRVARRSRIFNKVIKENAVIQVSASHDGYTRLAGKPIHNRKWELSGSRLVICDKVSGCGSHKIDVVFCLHPDIEIDKIIGCGVALVVDGHRVELVVSGDGQLLLEDSTYHPEFGLSVNNKKLIYRVVTELPAKIVTDIIW